MVASAGEIVRRLLVGATSGIDPCQRKSLALRAASWDSWRCLSCIGLRFSHKRAACSHRHRMCLFDVSLVAAAPSASLNEDVQSTFHVVSDVLVDVSHCRTPDVSHPSAYAWPANQLELAYFYKPSEPMRTDTADILLSYAGMKALASIAILQQMQWEGRSVPVLRSACVALLTATCSNVCRCQATGLFLRLARTSAVATALHPAVQRSRE